MKYVLIELQTNLDGTVGNLVSTYDDLDHAQSAYHSVLSAAAISTLPCHAAVLVTNEGQVVERRGYKHASETTS